MGHVNTTLVGVDGRCDFGAEGGEQREVVQSVGQNPEAKFVSVRVDAWSVTS